MIRTASLAAALVLCLAPAIAQPVPAAIGTDPAPDTKFPARAAVIHIPSAGVAINGLVYVASGPGPHPTLVLCHGLPGNEKNLDLAQAVRRAGWNAVTFNYRGSWGSPGSFSFAHTLEDTAAVLAYLRTQATIQALRIDPARIVLAGHSMGGWVTAQTAATDHDLAGAILISAWDAGANGAADTATPARLVAGMAGNSETLAGTSPGAMADELIAHGAAWSFPPLADKLTRTRLLVLTSDDGNGPNDMALVAAIRKRGGHLASESHAATDHGWSDHRIALETLVLDWLAALPGKAPHTAR
jgi:pimeloyl-ACP methyl ester carboxylesterase